MDALVADSSDATLRALAAAAAAKLDALAAGTVELKMSASALAGISARVRYCVKVRASPSPERQHDPSRLEYREAASASTSRSPPSRFFRALFSQSPSKHSAGRDSSGRQRQDPIEPEPTSMTASTAVFLPDDEAGRISPDINSAIQIISEVFHRAKCLVVVGHAPDTALEIDMSRLPDNATTRTNALKRELFQQYETAVDLRAFSSLTRVTFKNCRIVLLRGAHSIVELVLMRSTILLPPSDVVRAHRGASLHCDELGIGENDPDPDVGAPHDDLPAPTGTSHTRGISASVRSTDDVAAPSSADAASVTAATAAAAAAAEAASCALTWSGMPNLAVLRCYDSTAPLYPVPPVGVAMAAPTLRHVELVRSVDGPTFVFHRPTDVRALARPHWQLLTDLDLSANYLDCIDSSWGMLRELQKLNLNDNRIRHLDPCLGECEKLQVVHLRNNLIDNVRNIFSCLPRVRHLDMSQNQLVSIVGIAQLEQLQHLSVNSNKLVFWTDIKLLSENCGSLQFFSFIDNPLCMFVYRNDIVKLASALFWSKKDVRLNGLGPLHMSEAQQLDVLKKYTSLFKDSPPASAAAAVDAAAGEEALPVADTEGVRSTSSTRHLRQQQPGKPNNKGIAQILSDAGNADAGSLVAAYSSSRSQFAEEAQGAGDPQRWRYRKMKRRVKKLPATIQGEEIRGGGGGGEMADAFRRDPDVMEIGSAALPRPPSMAVVDEATGDVADPAFLKQKYGIHWLQVYRRLIPAPAAGQQGAAGMGDEDATRTPTDVTSESADTPRQQAEEGTATPPDARTGGEAATDTPPPPPPTHYEPIPEAQFKTLVAPALRKFVKRLLDTDAFAWRGTDGTLVFPRGAHWKTVALSWSEKAAAAPPISIFTAAERLRAFSMGAGTLDPFSVYAGGNIWQTSIARGAPVPEIWLCQDEEPIPLEISRYEGKSLLRVDSFEYENGIGFAVRIKHMTSMVAPVSFPRPALTSMHYFPAKIGRAQFANELQLRNIGVAGAPGSEGHGRTSGSYPSVTLSPAQMYNLTSIFSDPQPAKMMCGFVLPCAEAADALLQVLFRKLEQFRDPHYIPSPADWPLYQEPELPIEVPLIVDSHAIETRADADDAPLWPLLRDTSIKDDAEVLAKQRTGADLRVQCDEIAMYISSQLLPKAAVAASIDESATPRGGGATTAVADAAGANRSGGKSTCRMIGTTWANIINSDTGLEESCFVIILPTTICLQRDGNWEGSTMPLENLFQPALTFPVFQLEAVVVSFGFQFVCLDFGQGIPPLLLALRDPSTALRLMAQIRQVAEPATLFIMEPWPHEEPLRALLATAAPAAAKAGADSSESPTTPSCSSADARLPSSHSSPSMRNGARDDTDGVDGEPLLMGYFCAFAAFLLEGAAANEGVGSSRAAGDSSAPATARGERAAAGVVDRSARQKSRKSFIRRLWGPGGGGSDGGGGAASSPTPQRHASPTAGDNASQLRFPTAFSGSSAASLASAAQLDTLPHRYRVGDKTTYPLRHIHLPEQPVEWGRVSLMLTGDGALLYLVDEEVHTWPFSIKPSRYATVLEALPVKSLSWAEVTPPFSVFPLLLLLHFTSDAGLANSRILVCFQSRTALDGFVKALGKSFCKATGGGVLAVTQLRTAAYGRAEQSPTALMTSIIARGTAAAAAREPSRGGPADGAAARPEGGGTARRSLFVSTHPRL